jgi:DNA-binding CsgD family transcriptional regulator
VSHAKRDMVIWLGSTPRHHGDTPRAVVLTPKDRQELERLVRSGKTEPRLALRARIVLGAADGQSNSGLAKALKTSRPTVIAWRHRVAEGGVPALSDDRPRG